MELRALKDILFEMSGARTSNDGKKITGKRALAQARQYSQLNYTDEISGDSSVLDALFNMKSFTLEIVADRLDDIHECFKVENAGLESFIARLTDNLDSDSITAGCTSNSFDLGSKHGDSVDDAGIAQAMSKVNLTERNNRNATSTTGNGNNSNPSSSGNSRSNSSSALPGDKMEVCTVCSVKKNVTLLSSAVVNTAAAFVCSTCQTKKIRRDAKLGTNSGSSTSHATSSGMISSRSTPAGVRTDAHFEETQANQAESSNQHNNNDDSPDARPKSASRTSKFRSKLDSARFDRHFMEEF